MNRKPAIENSPIAAKANAIQLLQGALGLSATDFEPVTEGSGIRPEPGRPAPTRTRDWVPARIATSADVAADRPALGARSARRSVARARRSLAVAAGEAAFGRSELPCPAVLTELPSERAVSPTGFALDDAATA